MNNWFAISSLLIGHAAIEQQDRFIRSPGQYVWDSARLLSNGAVQWFVFLSSGQPAILRCKWSVRRKTAAQKWLANVQKAPRKPSVHATVSLWELARSAQACRSRPADHHALLLVTQTKPVDPMLAERTDMGRRPALSRGLTDKRRTGFTRCHQPDPAYCWRRRLDGAVAVTGLALFLNRRRTGNVSGQWCFCKYISLQLKHCGCVCVLLVGFVPLDLKSHPSPVWALSYHSIAWKDKVGLWYVLGRESLFSLRHQDPDDIYTREGF